MPLPAARTGVRSAESTATDGADSSAPTCMQHMQATGYPSRCPHAARRAPMRHARPHCARAWARCPSPPPACLRCPACRIGCAGLAGSRSTAPLRSHLRVTVQQALTQRGVKVRELWPPTVASRRTSKINTESPSIIPRYCTLLLQGRAVSGANGAACHGGSGPAGGAGGGAAAARCTGGRRVYP